MVVWTELGTWGIDPSEAGRGGGMTRGKQKIDAQRKSAEKNQKSKGSQLEARAVGLKVVCPICKVSARALFFFFFLIPTISARI